MNNGDRPSSRGRGMLSRLVDRILWLVLLLLYGRLVMTQTDHSSPRASVLRIWLEAGLLWLILLALFGANAYLAFVPFGLWNVVVHMSIAGVMIALLVLIFMDFRKYTALLRLAACAGVFWLLFMFALTGADYFTRF
jgi:cytochrome c oxidase subunit IV